MYGIDDRVRRLAHSRERESLPLLAIMEERATAIVPSPQEMFACPRLSALQLTRGGCARRWEAAQERRPAPWDSLHPCLTCPTGAAHAGRPGEGCFAPAETLQGICTRCARSTSRGLSGRMVNDRFCISCYNRDLEVKKGRNAKGTRPRLVLRDMVLSVEDRGVVRQARHHQVLSASEAMLAEAKRARGPLTFLGALLQPAKSEWRPAPHLCRFCLSIVLERAGIFRCSLNCGAQNGTAPEAICGCGLQVAGSSAQRRKFFHCRPQLVCSSPVSAPVVIAFDEGTSHNC